MKNFTRKQSLYFIFVLSLIIAIPIGVYSYFQISPYKFEVVKKTFSTLPNSRLILYHDFDHDGIQETIESMLDKELELNYLLIYSFYDELYDQFNFDGKFSPSNRHFFYDVNKDSVDELIAFDIVSDSLFINAIDIVSKSFLFKGVFVIEKPDSVKKKFWDIYVQDGEFIDMNEDGEKDFVFVLKASYAKSPRGIFVFDFKQMKLIDSFDFGAVGHILIRDLNGDGEEEIIPRSQASGNLEKTGLHDYSAWYIPLNKKLEPIVKPISFGDLSSSSDYYLSENVNYALFSRGTLNKTEKGVVFRINKDFSLSKVLDLSFKDYIPLKAGESTNLLIMDAFSGKLMLFDENLRLIRDFNNGYSSNEMGLVKEIKIDIDHDNKGEFFLVSINVITLYNQEFEVLAKYQTDNNTSNIQKTEVFFQNNEIFVSLNTDIEHNLVRLVKNPYYSIFFILAFGGWIVLTGFLYVNYIIVLYFLLYLNYFLHSFRKSNTALLILNSVGKTIYINKQTYSMLNLGKSLKRKPAVKDLFADKKEILSTIDEAKYYNRPVQNSFFYSTPETQINGMVSATPFILFRWITLGYLIEIENYTEAILLERTKIWAKSVLRIAHDIKTPLSSVALGIQTLKNAIAEENLLDRERSEEFDGIINELSRVRNLTKNFLKFINMETVNYQIVSVAQIMEETLQKFSQFFGTKEISLVKEFGEESLIWGDPFQLGQLFQILTENAIDAVSGKGKIRIVIKNTPDNEKKSRIVRIDISDDGTGITPELKEKLFSPYISTKKDGTGIGLFIAKKICEDHKGIISFESEFGKGTTFSLEFASVSSEEFKEIV
ncbi:MAG TPA: HAMP domain-containing sensor histidine kinase [Ignavibacteriaceae bacterium]|nr:HAMP domain-containing sensor histidine kinase [Ignavibacteriaceae bacterium]